MWTFPVDPSDMAEPLFADAYRTDLSGYDFCGHDYLEDEFYDELKGLEQEAEVFFLHTLKGEVV